MLLGAASYSLYLTHPFVAIAIELVARRLELLDGPVLIVILGLAVTAMLAAALVVHRLVEHPLDRAARRIVTGVRSRLVSSIGARA